jgi:hypothetical protein
MRAIDAGAPRNPSTLIDRAGAAVAREALACSAALRPHVNVIAGPGNNGADGRVAAARLRERGCRVRVFDAADVPDVLPPADLVIDAAYGTGFRGTWRHRRRRRPVLAVDVPTGCRRAHRHRAGPVLRAERPRSRSPPRSRSATSVPAASCAGELVVADIGLDVAGDHRTASSRRADVAAWLRPRQHGPQVANAVRVVAGSPGMTGAAHLAPTARSQSGPASCTWSRQSRAPTARPAVEAVGGALPPFDWARTGARATCTVSGAGGRSRARPRGLHRAVDRCTEVVTRAVVPVVVDGDGLFAMSWNEAGTPACSASAEAPRCSPRTTASSRCSPARRRARPDPATRRLARRHRLRRAAEGARPRSSPHPTDGCASSPTATSGSPPPAAATCSPGSSGADRDAGSTRGHAAAARRVVHADAGNALPARGSSRATCRRDPRRRSNRTGVMTTGRWAWAEVDLDAVAHNVPCCRRAAAPAAVWAVVKADGYGHGAVEVARAALAAGADRVVRGADRRGGEQLRRAGSTPPCSC